MQPRLDDTAHHATRGDDRIVGTYAVGRPEVDEQGLENGIGTEPLPDDPPPALLPGRLGD